MQSTRSTLFLICAMILWLLCIQCSGLKQRFARVVRAEKFTRIGMVKSKSTVQCLDLLNYVEENAMGTFEEYSKIKQFLF